MALFPKLKVLKGLISCSVPSVSMDESVLLWGTKLVYVHSYIYLGVVIENKLIFNNFFKEKSNKMNLWIYHQCPKLRNFFHAPGLKIWDIYVCLEFFFLYYPYKFRVHSLQNPCTRLENHAPRVQGALLIMDTDHHGRMRKYITRDIAHLKYKQTILPISEYADLMVESGPKGINVNQLQDFQVRAL